jgi:hypothetical protein
VQPLSSVAAPGAGIVAAATVATAGLGRSTAALATADDGGGMTATIAMVITAALAATAMMLFTMRPLSLAV